MQTTKPGAENAIVGDPGGCQPSGAFAVGGACEAMAAMRGDPTATEIVALSYRFLTKDLVVNLRPTPETALLAI